MPLYEYQCPACGCRFEELVAANAPDPACPRCGGTNVSRLLSAANCPGQAKSQGDNPAAGPFPTSLGCGSGGFS